MSIAVEDRVPLAPIVAAFERSEMTLSELALAMGFTCTNSKVRDARKADTARLRRLLGLSESHNGSGYFYRAEFVRHERACMLVRAMGYDPVDFREIGL